MNANKPGQIPLWAMYAATLVIAILAVVLVGWGFWGWWS